MLYNNGNTFIRLREHDVNDHRRSSDGSASTVAAIVDRAHVTSFT